MVARRSLIAGLAFLAPALAAKKVSGGSRAPAFTVIDKDTTFADFVGLTGEPGFQIARGATLTFDRGFTAPPRTVFHGPGKVVFKTAFQRAGYAEWWGARVNDPAFDNTQALQAALDSCPIVELMGADYYFSSRLVMGKSGRVLRGVSSNQNGDPGGSRLMLTSATADGLLVGFDRKATEEAAQKWVEHVTVEHLTIRRTRPPQPIANSGPGLVDGFVASPTGLRMMHAVSCYIDDVYCIDHTNGFYSEGAVHAYYRYSESIRNFPPQTSFDFYNGFLQNNGINVGYASGNASLYYRDCSVFGAVGIGQTFPGGAAGLYTAGGFTDTFVFGLETGILNYGIVANGAGPKNATYSSEDLTIQNCVLDGNANAGIRINAGNDFTAVVISGNYINPDGAATGIEIIETNGSVSINANQLISVGGNSATGLRVERAGGVISKGNIFTNLSRPIVFDHANNCSTEDQVNNVLVAVAKAAVDYIETSRTSFRGTIKGAPGLFGTGVSLDLTSTHNEIDVTGIDVACLVRREARRKLSLGGVPVVAPGPFGADNLSTGIMD